MSTVHGDVCPESTGEKRHASARASKVLRGSPVIKPDISCAAYVQMVPRKCAMKSPSRLGWRAGHASVTPRQAQELFARVSFADSNAHSAAQLRC
jgi:hypothetical protein